MEADTVPVPGQCVRQGDGTDAEQGGNSSAWRSQGGVLPEGALEAALTG